jgi:hypothetical protein
MKVCIRAELVDLVTVDMGDSPVIYTCDDNSVQWVGVVGGILCVTVGHQPPCVV